MDSVDDDDDDAVVIGRDDVCDYNEDNILPQSEQTLKQIRAWLNPTEYDHDGSEYQKHLSSHLAAMQVNQRPQAALRDWLAQILRGVKVLESDVAAYIKNRLGESPISIESHPLVLKTVLKRVDGIFLYAKLALDVGETPLFSVFRHGRVYAAVASRDPEPPSIETRQSKVEGEIRADWHAVSNKGETLLHAVAARTNEDEKDLPCPGRRLQRFKFLMGKGLDLMKESNEYCMPLDVADAIGHDDILNLLK
ncbi:hypothetical protein B0T17DRAFT_616636 [Bombardia bombarda]|uniref:Uncharacterized protein n=1 Tax=Bombardia bombarda TaxID=252184 RepID=A0AA39XBV2_9PEZI|nr:hypothetical protein B0T17DRAFT_616636 [Bombardia bombarda]